MTLVSASEGVSLNVRSAATEVEKALTLL